MLSLRHKASLAALSAVCLGAVLTIAATSASASSTVSGSPSAATPYCTVTISNSTVGPEQCYATQASMDAAIPNVLTVISVDYIDANYRGDSLTWTVSGSVTCNIFPSYQASSMPSGWNDIVSSYIDYANCNRNPHYENIRFTGAVADCGPNCSYIGNAMNDRTSSEKWGSR